MNRRMQLPTEQSANLETAQPSPLLPPVPRRQLLDDLYDVSPVRKSSEEQKYRMQKLRMSPEEFKYRMQKRREDAMREYNIPN